MKKNNEKELGQFFEQFKELSTYYKIEQVHRLIESPEALARFQKRGKYKPFKFIIMTSAIVVAISAIIFLIQPFNNIETNELENIDPNQIANNQQNPPNGTINSNKTTPSNPSNELWATDSIIDVEKMIIELTRSELEKLGFLIDNTGIYYFNEFNDEITAYHMRDEDGNGETTRIINFRNRQNKKEASQFPFYPATITSRWNLLGTGKYPRKEFTSINDTLIPILIDFATLGFPKKENQVIWFAGNDVIFQQLPNRYAWMNEHYQKVKADKKANRATNMVDFSPENIIDEISCVQLSQAELEQLGFRFDDEKISLKLWKENVKKDTINFKASKLTTYETKLLDIYECPQMQLDFSLMEGGTAMHINYSEKDNSDIPLIFYITNLTGIQQVQWSKQTDLYNKYQREYFLNKLDLLVPILLKQCDYPEILSEDIIYWFEPGALLFEQLPENIAKQLEYEFDILMGTKDVQEDYNLDRCVYFEACKSTLMLDDLKIYPNPAKNQATIQFNYEESIAGSIELIDLRGSKLRTLIPHTQFINGLNSYRLELAGITPGMYLISVQSEKGFKTVRLIVKE